MLVYFVRHGETDENAHNIHQDKNTKLNEIGINESHALANRLKEVKFDKILSSPFKRAMQTAEIITEQTGQGIEYSELWKEIKRPSEMEKRSVKSPLVKKIKQKIMENQNNPLWHYSDEENGEDIKQRALKAIKLLEKQKGKNILVVSHAVFLRVLLGVMLFGEGMKGEYSYILEEFFYNANTGISIFEFKEGKWSLITWNDYSHLKGHHTLKK